MKLKYLVISIILGVLSLFIILILYEIFAVGCLISLPLLIIALIFFIKSFTAEPTPALIQNYKMCPRCSRMIDYYASECGWCGVDCKKGYNGLPPPVYPHPPFPPHASPPRYYPPPHGYPDNSPGAEPRTIKKCKQCKRSVEKDWKLCPHCGKKLAAKKSLKKALRH
jgi:RNA polymerase subunit RPABC4/transcription elongation factor Spt4